MVLEGWIDSGFSAGSAVQALLTGLDTYPVATFDADHLLDHRARRPCPVVRVARHRLLLPVRPSVRPEARTGSFGPTALVLRWFPFE